MVQRMIAGIVQRPEPSMEPLVVVVGLRFGSPSGLKEETATINGDKLFTNVSTCQS